MSAEAIKEFFVTIGFKVDEAGLKRFERSIGGATKAAERLGLAATVMAVAAQAAVVKISKHFEDLYYASQRINSSVENIRAMDYAVGQMGGTAQGARAALEGIASFIRSNPAGEAWISGMGIVTREANGELRDTAEILKDLGDRFRTMPYWAAKQRAGMLGIDEITLQALIRGTDEFADSYSEAARRIGIDHEAAAKASHDFMVAVRALKMQLELLIAKLLLTLQNSKMLERLVANLTPVFEFLGRIVGRLAEWFGKADDATGGWSTALLVLFGVLAPIVAILGPVVAGVIALVVAIAALIDDFQTWREGGKSLIDWEVWVGEISRVLDALKPFIRWLGILLGAVVDAGAAILKWMGPYVGNIAHAFLESLIAGLNVVAGAIRTIVALLRGDWGAAFASAKQTGGAWLEGWGKIWDKLSGGRDRAGAPAAAAQGGSSAAAPAAAGGRGVGAQMEAFLRKQGFSAAVAQGSTAGAWAESRLDPNAVNPTSGAYGIGQWLGSRKAELFRRYGRRPTLSQQMEFLAWELAGGDHGGAAVRRQSTAEGALDAYIRRFMRPAPGAETNGDLARGSQYLASQFQRPVYAAGAAGQGVSITQKTDIHVNGSGDPNAAGRAVAGEQGRVNGNLVRYTRGALR